MSAAGKKFSAAGNGWATNYRSDRSPWERISPDTIQIWPFVAVTPTDDFRREIAVRLVSAYRQNREQQQT